MVFPETLSILIIDKKTDLPVSKIAALLTLFANHKNDYSFIPSVSNDAGIITIERAWVEEQIKEAKNTFIMDYASTLSDCKPFIEINILDSQQVQKAIKSMTGWKSIMNIPQKEIDDLIEAVNDRYQPCRQTINLNGENNVWVEFKIDPDHCIE